MLNRILVPTGTKQTAVITALALLLVAAALLVFLQSPSAAQGNDKATGNLALSSPNPGELVITWNAPSNAPDDYRVTWKKSDGRWHSYKNDNTVEGGNAFPTGTSHTLSGLEEGTAYQARVRARYHNSGGKVEHSGPWSDAVEITISATPSQDGEGDSNEGRSTSPPAKPTGLITAASHDNVLLSWDDPDDDSITGYQVLRGPDADNLAVLLDDTGSTSASYTDSTVEAEMTYVYAVRGRNAHGLGQQSDPVSATTPAAPPAKPTGLLTAASHDSVLLAWDNPDDDSITGYQVLRGEDADNLAVLLDDTGSTSASYTDSTVEAEMTYVYAVRGRNAHGLGQQSDPVSATTPAAPPAKPTGLLTAASHDSVLLAWDNPDDDSITGYQVLRGPDADNLAVLTDDTESAGTSYTDSSAVAQTTYVYAVRARNTHGLGPQSDPVTVTTSAAPEEDDPPTSARALSSVEFTLHGKDVRTVYACRFIGFADITDDCTIDIDTTTPIFAVDGTMDEDYDLTVKVDSKTSNGNSAPEVVDQDDLIGTDQQVTLTFQVGRNQLHLRGDRDGFSNPYYQTVNRYLRVNVVSKWNASFTLDGEELDTTGTCDEDAIKSIAANCTIDLDSTTAIFAVDGTLQGSDDLLTVKIGRDISNADSAPAVVEHNGLIGTDRQVELTFRVGTNLLHVSGHYYKVVAEKPDPLGPYEVGDGFSMRFPETFPIEYYYPHGDTRGFTMSWTECRITSRDVYGHLVHGDGLRFNESSRVLSGRIPSVYGSSSYHEGKSIHPTTYYLGYEVKGTHVVSYKKSPGSGTGGFRYWTITRNCKGTLDYYITIEEPEPEP